MGRTAEITLKLYITLCHVDASILNCCMSHVFKIHEVFTLHFSKLLTDVAQSIQSARLSVHCPVVKIGSPHPLTPQASVAPSSIGSKEVDTLAYGRGTNSNNGTDTLVLYEMWYVVLPQSLTAKETV